MTRQLDAVRFENMNEAAWTKWFRDRVVKDWGWLRYHTHRSDFSPAGFPDETLVRGERLVFAELKSAKGVVSDLQQLWLDALAAVPGVEVHVFRPADWERVVEILAPPGWRIHH